MYSRLNVCALAVVLCATAFLAGPSRVSATYLNPLQADEGVVFCCDTGPQTHCCFETGCATMAGKCVQVR